MWGLLIWGYLGDDIIQNFFASVCAKQVDTEPISIFSPSLAFQLWPSIGYNWF